ncbi:MAG: hypothetical protein R2684_04745 [Pyrinomonadaceae bacterium]
MNIKSIVLHGCAVRELETDGGTILEFRPVDPESGRVVDERAIRCHMEIDILTGVVTCHTIDCRSPYGCKKITDGEGNRYCFCTKQQGDPD